MAALRTVVEVSFTTSPDSASPVWVDISAYVDMEAGIGIERGRPDQFSTVPPGRATLTLDNSDGRFTPGYTSGAYYPDIKLGRRLRISVTDGTNTYRRFDGRVEAWPTQWAPTGLYASATITVVDRMKKLGSTELPDIISAEIDAAGPPVCPWTMGDPAGSTRAENRASATGDDPLVVQESTVTFGTATGPGTDDLTAAQASGGGWMRAVRTTADPFVAAQGAWSVAIWFNLSTDPTTTSPLICLGTADGDFCGLFLENNIGSAYVFGGYSLLSGIDYADGQTHFFGLSCTAGDGSTGDYTFYIDGAVVGSLTNDTYAREAIIDVSVMGTTFGAAYSISNQVQTISFAHAALWDTALSTTDFARIYGAGLDGNAGEATGDRIYRLARLAGVDTSEITADVGQSTVQAQLTGGHKVLDLMREAETSEDGVLFIDRTGKVGFLSRSNKWGLASSATLTAGQYGDDLQPILDDFGVTNDVTVSRGSDYQSFRAKDQTSINDLGLYSDSVDTILDTDTQARDRANYIINVSSTPSVRWPQVSVDLITQESLQGTVLGLDIGERLTLSGLPSTAPATTVDLLVEGYSEAISLTAYTVTFNCSPYLAQYDVLTLDDNTFGLLDSNYLGL